MRYYLNKTVWQAARERIRFLFDEFPNVVVGVSGGKDSTVVFRLALEVAREKDRLPLKVLWIDQEAEWQATVETVRDIMYRPDVEPKWYQMPIRLFNATSTSEHWLHCWDPAEEARWMRPKDPISVKVNIYGTDRFARLFKAILAVEYPDLPTAYIGGVRAEESPARHMALTEHPSYKWITWGNALDSERRHITFYPIYDWSYQDVWKAIVDNGWPYNPIYDAQYARGYQLRDMRVSNLHHETAVMHLFFAAEIEPETYARLTQRLAGIDMAAKFGREDYYCPAALPFMFASWAEYRDYLLAHLIDNAHWRMLFARRFAKMDALYVADLGDEVYRVQINSILTNDWEGIKLDAFQKMMRVADVRRRKRREWARGDAPARV